MLPLGPGSHRRERKVGDALWSSEARSAFASPSVFRLSPRSLPRESPDRLCFCLFMFKETSRGWGVFTLR